MAAETLRIDSDAEIRIDTERAIRIDMDLETAPPARRQAKFIAPNGGKFPSIWRDRTG